ncbi:uncharacterized protein A1O9_07528 [Exophiala aquamarina CBS 119918]|uniref:DUF1223-domain-containing protein n=1 Tax=Exophiala aquamarina CBS 119918 TaxID=1182545 RepID=A0A072P9J4_9EURO|nr:uncharacterized protein A1O9_07528 [Exophiala aquamarina CBS 119918]KEF55948.1 hypothetical protein A1O9_07528 [Exophiala aquamarina CBS 119918]
MSLDHDHTHTAACFVDIRPLSVVELFQSQGCVSCPPALPGIHDATNNPNLLLLTYDVTYWNASSGWEDTFGSSQWDSRQRQYVQRWGRNGIFTPQIVIDGVSDGIGATKENINEVITKAMEVRNNMQWAVGLDRVGNDLRIASEMPEADQVYNVYIVKFQPTHETVKVGKGPNKGKKVPHRNIVKELTQVGEWRGGIERIQLPAFRNDGYERVALVQGGIGGPIIGALRL